MSDIAIKVENLHKLYRLGLKECSKDTLSATMVSWLKAPIRNFYQLRSLDQLDLDSNDPDVLHALDDVSFEVKHGEVLGIIGRNGAGKSTLLKVLSRITEPTAGRITINGRVASLLEVGTGFHPELTGRENTYMNGTILGMRKKEIDRKFEEIIDFSGVEKFLDTPVKRYSSGMKVRLAFSVAAHLEPEILIIDEVLAVGDAEFQKKCLGKMQDVSSGGRTVLFVSHNMGAIQTLCPRSLLLSHGRMIDDGDSDQVVRRYLSRMIRKQEETFSLDNPDRTNSGVLRLTYACVVDKEGLETTSIIAGKDIAFKFYYESDHNLSNLELTFTIYDDFGLAITSINTTLENFTLRESGYSGNITCKIPKFPFALGDYSLSVGVFSESEQHDHISGAIRFRVVDSIFFNSTKIPNRSYCKVYVGHTWSNKITD